MHDTLDYLALDPVHRRHHHHAMTFAMLYAHDERFVLPLSHDEVVHGKGSLLSKMAGDGLERFAGLRALFAWQWALPGAPLVFMGSELAPWDEWSDGSELPWHLLELAAHRGVHDLLVRLNAVADDWPALWRRDLDPGGFQWLDADDADHSMYGVHPLGSRRCCCCRVRCELLPRGPSGLPRRACRGVASGRSCSTPMRRRGRGAERRTGDGMIAATDDPWQGCSSSSVLDVDPMSVIWLAARSPG